MSVCRRFPKCTGSVQDLIPITKVSHNRRTVKFFCQTSHTVFDTVCERSLDPCPVPGDLLVRDGLDPLRSILTVPLTLVVFEQYLVETVTSGHRVPTEWEGKIVKLLPKKESEEHVLEINRPICLMTTVMKLVTGI